jgi:hypothetical protein
MNKALVITIFYSALLGAAWFAVFHYIEHGTSLFYILLFSPSILIVFTCALDMQSASNLRRRYYRKMKVLEIERELDKELWWWLPSETRKKWFHECGEMIDTYNKKIRAWRDSAD